MALARLRPHRLEPFDAVAHDPGNRGDGLDVVDDGGPGVQALGRRERRLQARLAAAALEGVEEGRLLAADVGAGPRVDGDVDVVVAPGPAALADQPGLARLADRREEAPVDVDDLAAQVDEAVVAADGEQADRHAFDEGVRIGHERGDVLAGARLGLVGVDHEVAGAAVGRRQEAPLQARRESGAAAADQAGVLDELGQLPRAVAPRLGQALVSAAGAVGGQRPRTRCVPRVRDDRGERSRG